jgi:digeranylgeranylglycerophospholipid reductase
MHRKYGRDAVEERVMAKSNLEFDVLVVGGGPAGLSAAASAVKKGLSVAVIEKDAGIADRIRTSGVTWLHEAEKWKLPPSFYNPIRRYEIYTPNRQYVEETPKAEACVLDVRKLYQYLAYQAAKAGVEIFLRTKVNSASYERDKKTVKIEANSPHGGLEFHGKIVIDASGFSTIVGRSLGLATPWSRFGIGAEYEAYAEKVDVDAWALMVGSTYSPAGYAWIFPVKENRVRIGVGVGRPESNENPLKRLTYLLEKKPGPLKKLGRISPIEFHYGVVPNQKPRKLTVAERVLLVGDSAGHLNPLLLEGIRFAIKFGNMAGEAAKKAIESDEYERELGKYEKKWKKEVWSNFHIGANVQRAWIKFSDEQWDKEISVLETLPIQEVLELFQCQFATRKLIRLAASYPKLLKSQSFSIVLKAKMRKAARKD